MRPQDIIDALGQLTDKQFVEMFYEAVQGRDIYRAEQKAFEAHLVLANAVRDAGSVDNSGWTLEVVCSAPGQRFADDSPLCQTGEHCGHPTVSWAKRARCPVCGEDAYGT